MSNEGNMSSPVTNLRRCLILACVLFSAFNFMVLILRSFEPSIQTLVPNEINELDGCYHVYLDLGSNIGNQVSFLKSFLVILAIYFLISEFRYEKYTSLICSSMPRYFQYLKSSLVTLPLAKSMCAP